MKKATSYLLSWLFYGIGHCAYLVSCASGWLYQKAMSVSGRIKEWGIR